MKTNPTKDRLLMLFLLSLLEKTLEEKKDFYFSEILLFLLNKEDLVAMAQWLFKQESVEPFGIIKNLNKEELLHLIGGNVHVVSYLIVHWKNKTVYPVTPEKIYGVLSQLNQQTHYLMNKLIAEWDEYDYSNYNALCEKAGVPKLVYGIFEQRVRESEKYLKAPLMPYFYNKQEALATFSAMDSKHKFQLMEL